MRKISALMICSFIMFLSGCATELSERAIIQAAAVDYDDGKYTVHALLFSGGGTDGIDISKENVVKVSGEGSTISEAVKQISVTCGKEIYMAENKLLIIGGGFSEQSVMSVLELMYFDMRCSLNMPVCCSVDAELLTDNRFVEGITSAEKPAEIIRIANSTGAYPYTTLMDILTDDEGGRATMLPEFTEGKNGDGLTSDKEGKLPVLSGSRLLFDGRLSAQYDSEQTEALMLLSGDSDTCYLSFVFNEKEYSIEAYGIKIDMIRDESGTGLDISAGFRQENGSALTGEPLDIARSMLEDKINSVLM